MNIIFFRPHLNGTGGAEKKNTRLCDYSSEDDSIAFVILYLNAIQNLDCLESGCVRARACGSPCGVGVF